MNFRCGKSGEIKKSEIKKWCVGLGIGERWAEKKKMGERWAPKNSAHLFFLKKMGASKKKKMGERWANKFSKKWNLLEK